MGQGFLLSLPLDAEQAQRLAAQGYWTLAPGV
jgi:hypothetical protein